MNRYCDPKQLERAWYLWLIAQDSPDLEPYRAAKVLWTRAAGSVSRPDPSHPLRSHCLALGKPVFFETLDGTFAAYGERMVSLPRSNLLPRQGLASLAQIRQLEDTGYLCEPTEPENWRQLLDTVYMICQGVATQFHQPNEDAKLELVHEGMAQLTQKLRDKKLVYSASGGSVFGLLTTTIFRILYSVMNSRNNRHRRFAKYLDEARSGYLQHQLR